MNKENINPGRKQNPRGLEKALEIVRIIDKNVEFNENSQIISGEIKLDVSRSLKLLGIIFGCGYRLFSSFSSSGGYEDGFYYSPVSIKKYELKPTKITNCPIHFYHHER